MSPRVLATLLLAVLVALASPALAQRNPEQLAREAAQREAMKALDMLDGEWRGPAKALTPDGSWHTFTQAERVGPMLDGAVKVIEGRGYEADGSISFNAFAVISYDPDSKAYTMRSYSGGRSGDYPIKPTPNGFAWEIQAGPNMKIAYEAVVQDGVWTEIGTRIPKDGVPQKFIELSVTRLGNSAWPLAGVIPPR